jgi:hypothetical protein
MRSKNIEEDMIEDRHFWYLGMNRMVLAIYSNNNNSNNNNNYCCYY